MFCLYWSTGQARGWRKKNIKALSGEYSGVVYVQVNQMWVWTDLHYTMGVKGPKILLFFPKIWAILLSIANDTSIKHQFSVICSRSLSDLFDFILTRGSLWLCIFSETFVDCLGLHETDSSIHTHEQKDSTLFTHNRQVPGRWIWDASLCDFKGGGQWCANPNPDSDSNPDSRHFWGGFGFGFGFRPQKVESGFGFKKNRVDSDSNPDSSFCLAITTLLKIYPLHSNHGSESKSSNTVVLYCTCILSFRSVSSIPTSRCLQWSMAKVHPPPPLLPTWIRLHRAYYMGTSYICTWGLLTFACTKNALIVRQGDVTSIFWSHQGPSEHIFLCDVLNWLLKAWKHACHVPLPYY